MSYFVVELPDVAVKSGKMINLSTTKMKVILAAVVLMLYVYLLLYFKSIYLRNKRLDEVMAVALKIDRRMLNIERLDKKLAMQIAQIHRFYEDY